jgi:hypothetical protein
MMVVSGRLAKNFFTYSGRSMVESGAILQHEKTHTVRVMLQVVFEIIHFFIMK